MRDITNKGGVWWDEMPPPPIDHACWAQTTGVGTDNTVERCPCGGFRYAGDPTWADVNSRTERILKGQP